MRRSRYTSPFDYENGKINHSAEGSFCVDDPSATPLQAPATRGLTPQLYLYIIGELVKPRGRRVEELGSEELYDLLFSYCMYGGLKPIFDELCAPLRFEIPYLAANPKPIDKLHVGLFELLAEDSDGSLPFVLGNIKSSRKVATKQKMIPRYTNGCLRVKKTVPGNVKPYALVAFIVTRWNVDNKTALKFVSALGGLTNRVLDIQERYGIAGKHIDKLPYYFKRMFRIVGPIYFLDTPEEELGIELTDYLRTIDGKYLDCGMKLNRKKSLVVLLSDFAKMSLRGKMILMRNLHHYEDEKLYVHLKTKQSYGNYGRQFNVLAELSRSDRKCISNLYGYDMATALQTILFYIYEPKGYSMPYTYKYILDKTDKREELSEATGLSIDGVKAMITAVYQGKSWGGEHHKHIKDLLVDAETIRSAIMSEEDDEHAEALKYATHACKHSTKVKMTRLQYERSTSKLKRFDYEKTFMFFFWTYHERLAQNIMSSHFNNPITLHDAVYTQDADDFKDFDPAQVEAEIFEQLKIPIKIEKT